MDSDGLLSLIDYVSQQFGSQRDSNISSAETTVLVKALNGSQWVSLSGELQDAWVSMGLNGTVQIEIQSMRFPGLT